MLPSPHNGVGISRDFADDPVPVIGGMELTFRTYRETDRWVVRRLYHHGLLAGNRDPLDPATDLDQIEEVYLRRPQDHFWVAETDGEVIGSIAIVEDDKRTTHVRRLRVDPGLEAWHRGEVARVLLQKATRHAREHGCLKLVLHTPVDDNRAIAFLHQLDFEFTRTREVHGRHVLEFYLDIYARIGSGAPAKGRPG